VKQKDWNGKRDYPSNEAQGFVFKSKYKSKNTWTGLGC